MCSSERCVLAASLGLASSQRAAHLWRVHPNIIAHHVPGCEEISPRITCTLPWTEAFNSVTHFPPSCVLEWADWHNYCRNLVSARRRRQDRWPPMSQAETPAKPCHNCRRQRLRCDRSYPHCNKCTNAGKECLGYGKLFRWTGAVASRGKLAGRTSSAPVTAKGGAVAAASELFASSGHSPSDTGYMSAISSTESANSPPTTPLGSCGATPESMQLVSSRATSVEKQLKTPYILVDPLYQDLGDSHRYYLSYCV